MNPWPIIRQYFRSLWRRGAIQQQIDEELEFHLAMREQDNLRDGMPPEEAARAARRRFGNWQSLREDCRQASGASFGSTVWQDVRFGLRMLRLRPGYALVVALTLALGIGVNASMFSMLNRFVRCRVPYVEPHRLIRIYDEDRAGSSDLRQAPGEYLEERERTSVFSHLCAFDNASSLNLSSPGNPADGVQAIRVTGDFFPVLGVAPLAGRAFAPEDETPGREDVVIVSREFWLNRFNSDPGVVGRVVRLDGKPATVVGVATVDDLLLFGGRVDVLRPLVFSSADRQDHDSQWLTVLGRLKPGVSLPQARAEVAAVAARIARDRPGDHATVNLKTTPLGESLVNPSAQRLLWFLMALTGLVLVITCANLVNLQLARTVARERELGIRAALGAGPFRIARQLLTETVVLSLVGGLLGLLFALACNCWFGSQFLLDPRNPRAVDIPMDARVIGFALFTAVASGVLIAVIPAWILLWKNRTAAHREDGRALSAGRRSHRLQNSLIVVQMALALMLLVSAAQIAIVAGEEALGGRGWRPEGLTAAELALNGPAYDSRTKRTAFLQRLADRVGALPGVERVSLSGGLPFERDSMWPLLLEGEPEPAPEQRPLTRMHEVDQEYFRTLGMVIRQGRDFTADEVANGAPVLIVSRGLAERLWPGRNPIGRRISPPGSEKYWMEVVGVVNHLSGSERFQAYRPLGGHEWARLVVRGPLVSQALAPALRRAVADLDPDLAVARIQTAQQILEAESASGRTIVWLVGGFGALGLLLAAVGIYGVTAHVVVQRTREFGLRMALGAPRTAVFWLVLRDGFRLSLLGGLLGMAGACGLMRIMGWLEAGLSPARASLPATAAFLVAVALLACWLPARRATRIDPMAALRWE